MTDKSKGNELERYAAVNTLMMNTYQQKCLDFKYANLISDLQKTSWDSSAAEGGKSVHLYFQSLINGIQVHFLDKVAEIMCCFTFLQHTLIRRYHTCCIL